MAHVIKETCIKRKLCKIKEISDSVALTGREFRSKEINKLKPIKDNKFSEGRTKIEKKLSQSTRI